MRTASACAIALRTWIVFDRSFSLDFPEYPFKLQGHCKLQHVEPIPQFVFFLARKCLHGAADYAAGELKDFRTQLEKSGGIEGHELKVTAEFFAAAATKIRQLQRNGPGPQIHNVSPWRPAHLTY
jgi:hypothetical protein